MRRLLTLLAAALVTTLALTAANVVPAPASIKPEAGTYAIAPGSSITVRGEHSSDAVSYLSRRGLEAQPTKSKSATVTLKANKSLAPEAYELAILPQGISIAYSTQAGLNYAIETLAQLLRQAPDGKLQCCVITDEPRWGYRGLMLDVVRCYLPIDEVKRFVDAAAQLKINTLHLHLTDDNGWRMEIQKYPKLTEVGAWRVDRPEIFPARHNAKEGEPTTYGGYYTQDQLRDLVQYAADRQITVVPEIEMPAHAIAAIASYPELACPGVTDQFVGVLPGIGGSMASVIMCAGRDSTLQFVRDVLDEVMEVFPSELIHLGGDEANKSHWEKCELCNARLGELGLDDMEQLQGWFMDQITAYVRQHGRTAIGWDEVTYGKPNEDMVIMGWQGDGSTAVNYARATGSKFIMTPALRTYLIRYQGPQWFEPFTYFGNITLRDVYDFDPVQPDWTPELEDQLMGIQGSMWTEFCRTPADVQYMVFPRLIALADAAWRPQGQKDWPEFMEATDAMLEHLSTDGINYARSMYNVQHRAVPNGDGTVTLTAECIRPDATVWISPYYDFAVKEAMPQSLTISEPKRVHLQATTDSGDEGMKLTLPFGFNDATGKAILTDNANNGYGYALLNGLRGSLRNSDFEWAGWHNRDAEVEIDLLDVLDIDNIVIGALSNADLTIALPAGIQIYGKTDANSDYVLLSEIAIPEGERFPTLANVKDFAFDNIGAKARYLRITAQNGGRVPAGMARDGAPTWVCFDEVMVNPASEYIVKEAVFPADATIDEKVEIASRVVPAQKQIDWQNLELTAFLHFGVNTFTDLEWGNGTEDPAIFMPDSLDTDQWVKTLKDAGFKLVILTAKHHDGFCLWPTATTPHSVAASPWMDGKGDVVKMLSESCRKYGMKLGLYISPWDRNAPCYGQGEDYNDMFVAQLTELLTRYGKVDEVWFDGANGEGPNGKKQVYDWQLFRHTIDNLQPDAVLAITGDDVRWVGNEDGLGRDTEWSVTALVPGIIDDAAATNERLGLRNQSPDLGSRNLLEKADKVYWWPSEVDVSIRPGWFYHDSEQPKTVAELADIYLKSVGKNSVLLLNIPPDRHGRIADADARRLMEFKHWRDASFGESRANVDAANPTVATLTAPVNAVVLSEEIDKGQRVEEFVIEGLTSDGTWQVLATGTTIGNKRILPISEYNGSQLRLNVTKSRGTPHAHIAGAYLMAKP